MTDTPNDSESPRLLTNKAAAAYVGVSTATFAKWVAAGLFPPSVSITKMWDRKAIDSQLDKLSGLASEPTKQDSFAIWKEGYELRKRERDAKKLTNPRLRNPDRWDAIVKNKSLGQREKQALGSYYGIEGGTHLEVKGAGYDTLKRLLARGYVVSVDPDPKAPMPICKITPAGEAAWLQIADREGIDF
jgi:predicted DNA-binding transcriptional regulator AlpA